MPKTLVVFYSLTGVTKTAAEELTRVVRRGADRMTRQAVKLFGSTGVQMLFLKDSEMKAGSFRGRVSDFVRVLRTLGA